MRNACAACRVLIVTPYLAGANNGNWRTAARWRRLLSRRHRTIVQSADEASIPETDVLIALHARRSRAAVARYRTERPQGPLVVALTGTDLYRDVAEANPDALASLQEADRIIVLQREAIRAMPEGCRAKVDVVHQSARTLERRPDKPQDRLSCVFVGHLRPEKNIEVVLRAWALLPPDAPIRLNIVGGALEPRLQARVEAASAQDRRIRWSGARPHAWTRQAIKRAHLLVCASWMEGGANVVVEAVTSGTPVLASRISGNLGMLGADYAGFFDPRDPAALAALVARAHADRAFLTLLQRQCAKRGRLFSPLVEQRALLASVARALTARADAARASDRTRTRSVPPRHYGKELP